LLARSTGKATKGCATINTLQFPSIGALDQYLDHTGDFADAKPQAGQDGTDARCNAQVAFQLALRHKLDRVSVVEKPRGNALSLLLGRDYVLVSFEGRPEKVGIAWRVRRLGRAPTS
jgi:hypothetical protein